MNGTLKIDILEKILRAWEDSNLLSNTLSEVHRSFPEMEELTMKTIRQALSHVDNGAFSAEERHAFHTTCARNIIDLRYRMITGQELDYEDYLIPVPKKLSFFFEDELDYIEGYGTGGLNSYPIFIGDWLRTKKVCHVDKKADIQPLSPCTENYLSHLPYDDFLVYFEDGIQLTVGQKESVLEYHHIMVSRHEDYVYFLALPKNIDQFLLKNKHRDLAKKIFLRSKKRGNTGLLMQAITRHKEMFLGCASGEIKFFAKQSKFSIKRNCLVQRVEEIRGESDFIVDEEEAEREIAGNVPGSYCLNLVFRVNALCKKLSEAKDKPVEGVSVGTATNLVATDKPEDNNTYTYSTDQKQKKKLEWNEVPLGEIMNVASRKETDGSTKTIIRIGSEVSPHIRRGHWRRISNGDGTYRRIWINQVTVRKDRIKDVGIRSGASRIAS
jgi:hypothetical protein